MTDKTWQEWLAEERAKSQMTTEVVPFSDTDGWGVQEEGARYGRPDGKFFDIIGVRISVPRGREVTSWCQPMLREVGEGVVVLAKSAGGGRYLLQARPEPGSDAPGCVTLTPTLQASLSNLEAAHGGKRPPRAELFDQAVRDRVDFVRVLEDGGRFHRKRNRYAVVEVASDAALNANERWFTRSDLIEAFAAGELTDHLAKAVLITSI